MSRLEAIVWDWTYFPYLVLSFIVFAGLSNWVSELSARLCPSYKNFPQDTKTIWHTYIFSMIHAIIMSILSVYALTTDPELWKDPIWCDSPVVRASCALCIGYMLFDAFNMARHYRLLGDWFFFLHHGATIYAYFVVMTYGVLPFFAIYRLLAEISTPFVDIRWMIDVLGYSKTSPQNIINGVLMTLSFFIVRILVMPHYWYIVYTVYGTDDFNRIGHIQLILVVSCFVLDVINLLWFYKMCRGVKKVLTLKFDANRNDIQKTS